jgi:hypothetical protein
MLSSRVAVASSPLDEQSAMSPAPTRTTGGPDAAMIVLVAEPIGRPVTPLRSSVHIAKAPSSVQVRIRRLVEPCVFFSIRTNLSACAADEHPSLG